MMSTASPRLNWINILFFIISPIIAILGTALLCVYTSIPWQTWCFALIYCGLTGLAITAGYHRLFSHRSYKALWPVRLVYLLLGAAAFEGSALEWCSDHRNHHLYTDTDKDPYNIKKGFWYAHILWLFHQDTTKYNFSNVQDLSADPLVRWQQKYYVWIATSMCFLLPLAVSSLWHDALGGFFIVGFLRMVLNHHAAFAINSVCHYFGKQTYSKRISARDNWLTSLITYGEGFHNFHHQFPLDYRNGVRFYHYDPTKWLIGLLSYLGLANELRRIDRAKVKAYRRKHGKAANRKTHVKVAPERNIAEI